MPAVTIAVERTGRKLRIHNVKHMPSKVLVLFSHLANRGNIKDKQMLYKTAIIINAGNREAAMEDPLVRLQ
jgi:hypothetical protein